MQRGDAACSPSEIRKWRIFTESIETKSLLEGKLKDEFIYLAALSILRNLYDKGVAEIGVLERINRKNAEKMNCTPIGII